MDKFKSHSKISFRSAVWEDAEFLLSLRNSPSVWPECIQARPVEREEHLEWFKKVLQRSDVKLFIILADGVSAGQVRYNFKQEGVFISIAMSPDHQGQGLGFLALKETGREVLSMPGVTVLKALVREGNKASLRCFERVGFFRTGTEKHENENFIMMEFKRE